MSVSKRWIVLSGLSSGAKPTTLAFDAAADLSTRHDVLFWDTASDFIRSGKNVTDILPYQNVFSAALLRSFLSYEQTSLCILQGPLPSTGPAGVDILNLLKASFEFVLVSAPPVWDTRYVALLDAADALFWVTSCDTDADREIDRHRNELTQRKFPKALGHVINDSAKIRAFARRLETDQTLYPPPSDPANDTTQDAKTRIHERLLKSSSPETTSPQESTPALLEHLIAEDPTLSASRETRERVFSELLDDVLGLGPLQSLLLDAEISEIMVNGPQFIFVEKKGRLYPTDVHFENETQLRTVIDRIVAPLGRRVDESTPLCDARLADGSRINIVLPPLSLDGPTLTIRKFMTKRLAMADLVESGTLSPEMADFLMRCVRARKNMIVSGGTGSGKTTLLNILSGYIAPEERIVTIEDAAELKLQQPHVVRMESRPPNAEGQGAISIRRLVTNALRMRPDRIVVGECRSGEALDMLQAMNTGHDGSLTTLHANTPRDALGRLEALVLMTGIDLPVRVVREQIKSAVHMIVQISRQTDGRRTITSVTELTGMEGDVLTTAELFRFKAGHFEATGLVSQGLPRHCEGEARGNPTHSGRTPEVWRPGC